MRDACSLSAESYGSIQDGLVHVTTGLSAELSQTQIVVSVTNKLTQQQAWFNKERTRKPQLFQQNDDLLDPTVAKQHCDFCQWQAYTASDPFGR